METKKIELFEGITFEILNLLIDSCVSLKTIELKLNNLKNDYLYMLKELNNTDNKNEIINISYALSKYELASSILENKKDTLRRERTIDANQILKNAPKYTEDIIIYVHNNPGIIHSDLAEQLGFNDNSKLTKCIDRIYSTNIIEKIKNDGEKKVHYYLTAYGNELYKKIEEDNIGIKYWFNKHISEINWEKISVFIAETKIKNNKMNFDFAENFKHIKGGTSYEFDEANKLGF